MRLLLNKRRAGAALLFALSAGPGCHHSRPATLATLQQVQRLRLESPEGVLIRARLADGTLAQAGCIARQATATLRKIAGDTLFLERVEIQRRGRDGARCAPPATAAVVVTAHPDLELSVVEPSAGRSFLAGSVTGLVVGFFGGLILYMVATEG